jgi:hypothetical protein
MRCLRVALALLLGQVVVPTVRADSAGPVLNPYRAYPASCLTDPLPAAPSGPTWSGRVTLPLLAPSGAEAVTVYLWRTPCSGRSSALLGEVVRDPQNSLSVPAPGFPSFSLQQGAKNLGFARVAVEPNTIRSSLGPGAPIFKVQQFVFENQPVTDVPQFDFNQAITVSVLNPNSSQVLLTGAIPAFDPAQYPSLPMQISGYQTGNYSDPSGGQGIQVEVTELASPAQRAIVVAWYTYDQTGTSYWLFNAANFNVGDRSVSLPLGYFSGGGFAGGQGSIAAAVWGNVTLTFPDCNHMNFTYQALSGLPSGVPIGTGSKTLTRVTSINGVTCDAP